MTTVLAQWREVIGMDRVTVREIIDRATDQRPQLYGQSEFIHPEFREALLRVAGEGGAINGGRLGKWIGAQQNRIANGLRLVSAGVSAGRARWQLQVAETSASPSPDGSESFRRDTDA